MRSRYLDLDDRSQDFAERLEEAPDIAKDFLKRYEISWLYHENALEGVIYTLQELVAALEPLPVVDATVVQAFRDVRNHKAAVEIVRAEARAKKPKVNLTLVKRLQETLTAGLPGKNGAELRKDIPIHRTYYHEIAPPQRIPAMLQKVLDVTDTADFRQSHPVQRAARLQHGFMQVFPFTEGSGKVARLLANLVLLHEGYLPCIIHSVDRQRYFDAFRMPEVALRDLMLEAIDNGLTNAEKFLSGAVAARTKRAAP
jgi:Fic family protein